MGNINRDVLGYLRRALKMGDSPPDPELIGVIQPIVKAFGLTPDKDVEVIDQTNALGAGATTVTITLPPNKHGFILHSFTQLVAGARAMDATLFVKTNLGNQVDITFYSGGSTSTHNAVIGQGEWVYFPCARDATPTAINFFFGAGLAGDAVNRLMVILLDRNDPIPIG